MSKPSSFSGALQPKKKADLQQIAAALRIPEDGTKDDLTARIKRHLDANQEFLEDDPVFSGLFSRRKRNTSVIPQSSPPRRVVALSPVRESTPIDNLRDVSAYLKATPFSPATPSSLPPLPDSPERSMQVAQADRSIIDHLPLSRPNVGLVVQRFKLNEEMARRSANQSIIAFRSFLSNSRNLWSLTAAFELLFILYTIIPWQTYNITLGSTIFAVPYPPSFTVTYPGFWPTLFHWAVPSVLLPALIGIIISFSPAVPTPTATDTIPFDPLTASIIRLALQFAYNPATLPSLGTVKGPIYAQDVLGVRLRVLNAAIGVAFAFAEAIKGAPAVWAKELLRKEDEPGPARRALTTEETVVEVE